MHTYSIYPKQYKDARHKVQSDSCFVVMPFSEDLNNTYLVIDSVAASMGIKCTRADNVSTTSEPILSKICKEISQAYFIIVDITNLNPNVFYELGIAHVLRDANKVLIIKEENTTCPSDINHLHYYPYNKLNLKQLKETLEKFFTENNILEDLYGVLDFLGLLHGDTISCRTYVAELSGCVGNDTDSLILVLNNKAIETTQRQTINLLNLLTCAFDQTKSSDKMYTLYSDLILLLVSKIQNVFDISEYLSKLFNGGYSNVTSEWIADCGVTVLDNPEYFASAFSWMVKYLQQSSPAEFDMAKYKIEIGIIKSSSTTIDSLLINELESTNKTLAEHCAKLIKERKTYSSIPILVKLIESEENPYVLRSCIDALISIAPLETLIKEKHVIEKRDKFIKANAFLNKHIEDLNRRITYLQNASNS